MLKSALMQTRTSPLKFRLPSLDPPSPPRKIKSHCHICRIGEGARPVFPIGVRRLFFDLDVFSNLLESRLFVNAFFIVSVIVDHRNGARRPELFSGPPLGFDEFRAVLMCVDFDISSLALAAPSQRNIWVRMKFVADGQRCIQGLAW